MDAYVASLQAVHSSLAAKGDALDVVERKVLEAQVRPPRPQTVESPSSDSSDSSD